MPVQLICDCGKRLTASDDHIGRQVKCPGCGKSYQVPDPAARSAALLPIHGGVAGGAGRRPVLLLLLVLLLLVGGAAAWWFLIHKGGTPALPEGDDLAQIPANAQGFICIRLADLWASPAAQKGIADARANDPKMEALDTKMERETSLRPDEVERVTLVGIDSDQRLGWAVVRTVNPYDRQQVLEKLRQREEQTYRGQRYTLGIGSDDQKRAIYFVGTRVLVVTTEEGMKRFLDFMLEPKVKGPLEPIIALAGEKHTAVVGIYPKGGPLEKIKADPYTRILTDMELIRAVVEVSEKASLDATVQMENQEKAQKVSETIKTQISLLQLVLALAPGTILKQKELIPLAPKLSKLLGKLKFAQKGKEMTVKADIEDGSSLAELILRLPRPQP